ncbi:MAG: 30S ribosomal protein S6 [Candidatus Taylorbacteria bacterium]|nr:30S ribosomal protein S6 [Candidatus Taylorbacteria bacterium]
MSETESLEQTESRIYELGFHVVSSIPEDKLPAEVTAVKDILAEHGAVTIAEDFPKLKHLTYTMTKVVGPKHLKFDTAYFGWVKFEINQERIDKVKTALERRESVLRFIIVKTVRESTLAIIKPPAYRPDIKPARGVGEIPKNKEIKSPISEAELDKTIEELMVE